MTLVERLPRLRWLASGIVGAIVLAFAVVSPALGAPPHVECRDADWNGQYWKQQFDNSQQPTGSPETNAGQNAISIEEPVVNRVVKWTNNSSSAVFRTYEKNGRVADDVTDLDPPVLSGDGGSFEVASSISHVTFCFTDASAGISIDKKTNGADPTAEDPNFIPVEDLNSDDNIDPTVVTWTYDVTNTGTLPLTSVVVTDNKGVAISGPSGDDGNGVLDPGEVWSYQATGSSQAGTYEDGFVGYTNTGTVTAQSSAGEVSDSDTSGYYGSDPSILLEVFGPTDPVEPGTTFQWLFRVTNDGNVPLGTVVVDESGTAITGCDWALILPGDFEECTLDEVAQQGGETSDFRATGVFDDGTTQTVVSKSVEDVAYQTNAGPTALADAYEVDEHNSTGGAGQLVVPAPGVLANDTDPDMDSLTATVVTQPSTGTLDEFLADGSFKYTPDQNYSWADGEQFRLDSFTYTASDGTDTSNAATVTLTVYRSLCALDSVDDEDGDVSAVITMLSSTGCKRWVPVIADGESDLVTFSPESDEDAVYEGALSKTNVFVADGTLPNVELWWNPDADAPLNTYVEIPSCSLVGGEIVLPGGAETGWCFYDLDMDLVGDQTYDLTWFVKGWDDPGFSFR